SRVQISKFAPKIEVLRVPVEKIGEIIGPGGKTIRKIISETGAAVDIEDDGTINISAPERSSVEKAVAWIKGLIQEVKVGDVFVGTVKRIQPFGAFVEILPGKEGLVHVSRMARGYVANPANIVRIGQKIKVKVVEIDELGRINLSMRDFPRPWRWGYVK
ncbi:MAG: S1 RNA-binding domain-containing protein, partial [Microgenomates group bacterium]